MLHVHARGCIIIGAALHLRSHIFTIIRLFKKHNLIPIKKVKHDIDGQCPFGNDLTKGTLSCTG